MPFEAKARWSVYTGPLEPLRYALWYLLETLWSGKVSGAREHAFATWYTTLGIHFARFEEELTPVPRLVALADGVTLELGPGSGNQLPRFNTKLVTRVYGVEPNGYFSDVLAAKLNDYPDMGRVYVHVNAALEDEAALDSQGIVDGSIDTVVCMQVLCCVPDPAAAAKRIHRLLKPGGQLLFWEHQKSSDKLTRVVQGFWNMFWSPLVAGCCLTTDIERAIMNAGPWRVEELEHDTSEPYNLLPRVWGRLIKLEA